MASREPDVRLLLQAESYAFDEIGHFTAFHPEAPRPDEITQNTLLIGPAGTGKSMAMRQAVYQLRDSKWYLPIYVHAERWVARPFSEAVAPSERPRQESDGRVRACATASLAYGTLARILRVVGPEVAHSAARVFPGRPGTPSEMSEWLDQSFHRCEYLVRTGEALPPELRSLPDLREIFEIFGGEVHGATGRTLLLFFDQLDRVSPLYLDLLSLALGRTTAYVLAVATRPSPCAPDPTDLALRAGDCTRRWLGANWGTPAWKAFLLEAASSVFEPKVCDALADQIDFVAPLIGHSTRYFLGIGKEFSRTLDGLPPELALQQAVGWMRGSVESELAPSLVHHPAPARFLRSLQNHLAAAAEEAGGVFPARVVIRPAAGFLLEDKTVERLRVAVREGLFVPAETASYGLDEVLGEYEVVPLAALKAAPVGPSRWVEP